MNSFLSAIARGGVAAGLFFSAVIGAAEAKPIRVVATIKPIHSLATAILDGIAIPTLLLQGASSPHTYALKPSDGEALAEADAIIRVSKNLEVFLDKPLLALPKHARIINLDEALDMTLLPVREGENYEHHEHGQEAEETTGHSHDHAHSDEMYDAHFWLDPQHAIIIVDDLAKEFSVLDPEHGEQIKANAEKLKARLAALDKELQEKLLPLSDRPFIVFHDVTQYIEKRYGLRNVGAITVSPERQPGARRLQAIREKIQLLGAVCVFSEPQFPPKLIDTLVESTRAKLGTFDEIGVESPAGPEQYFVFMRKNADNLASCLGAETETALTSR